MALLVIDAEAVDQLHLQVRHVECAGEAVQDLPAGGDDERVGVAAGPLGIERLRQGVPSRTGVDVVVGGAALLRERGLGAGRDGGVLPGQELDRKSVV